MAMSNRVSGWLTIVLPFGIYVGHAALLGDWIVDDAAIGFVYARNLAAGTGLVSQPGAEPVEGFSDFLWVGLMVPFFLAGIFHPVIVPKAIAGFLVLLTFLTIRHCLRRYNRAGCVVVGLVLTLLAVNSGFVVWTISGLENPLYVLLTVLLLWRGLALAGGSGATVLEALWCALLVTGAALTRPDGIVYAAVPPAILLACWWADRAKYPTGPVLRFFAVYYGSLLILLGGFVLFRFIYFRDLVPNTYHAKGASLIGTLHEMGWLGMIRKSNSLLDSVLVLFRPVLVGVLGLLLWRASARGCMGRPQWVWLLFMALSSWVFLLLPIDWMPLYRFATPFLVFFIGFWVSLAGELFRSAAWPPSRRWALGGTLVALVLGGTMFHYGQETASFREQPTMPFAAVSEAYGQRFNRYAEWLAVDNGSLLLPDLGGTLTCSHLRIYDLAGLCDRTIGRTLGRNQAAFYDYVFETVRPTFIHTHRNWSLDAHLQADSRFRRDYVALFEVEDSWVAQRFHRQRRSGDYVRRQAIAGKETAAERIRQDCRRFWNELLRGRFRGLLP